MCFKIIFTSFISDSTLYNLILFSYALKVAVFSTYSFSSILNLIADGLFLCASKLYSFNFSLTRLRNLILFSCTLKVATFPPYISISVFKLYREWTLFPCVFKDYVHFYLPGFTYYGLNLLDCTVKKVMCFPFLFLIRK